MKNVYRATRPTWSQMDKSEMRVILIASILVALIGSLGELLVHDEILNRYPQDRYPLISTIAHGAWGVLEVVVVTLGCVLIIRYYKKLSIGCYPTTFIYCFRMPSSSNPDGKSQVVGYCHVRPSLEVGEFEVTGASFFWESGQLNTDSRVGFKSTRVWGSKEKEETTCHIRFNIDAIDSEKRLYQHGVLHFRVDKVTGLNPREDRDIYAGYLQSTHKDSEIDVDVRSRGYAEWHSNGPLQVPKVQATLEKRGVELVASLQAMLRASPTPTLWDGIPDIPIAHKWPDPVLCTSAYESRLVL